LATLKRYAENWGKHVEDALWGDISAEVQKAPKLLGPANEVIQRIAKLVGIGPDFSITEADQLTNDLFKRLDELIAEVEKRVLIRKSKRLPSGVTPPKSKPKPKSQQKAMSDAEIRKDIQNRRKVANEKLDQMRKEEAEKEKRRKKKR
jgi:hypothetical protein